MPARRLLPKILVIRYDLDLPETSYYLHRDNEINLDEAIATISSLAKHPGRGKLEFKIDATTGQTGKYITHLDPVISPSSRRHHNANSIPQYL